MKNNDEKGFDNQKATVILSPEIVIPLVVHKATLFQQVRFTNSLPYSIPLSYKKELDKYLIELEKNLDIEKTSKEVQSIVAANKHIVVGKKTLIEHLCGGFLDQPYKLSFQDDVPRPAYKDKPFTLKGNIVDKDNNITVLLETMVFNAQLYRAEHPISPIESTKYNEKIITGNPVIETSNIIYFRKLIIKEVSSHHPCKMFILVIMPEDPKLVQPYIFTDIMVKTKSFKPCKLRKKFKVEKLIKFNDLP